MREALYNNFDEKLVKDRNEEQHDVQINFYNFCKYNKMQGRYTTKDIAESEQKVKETEKEFKKLLSHYKSTPCSPKSTKTKEKSKKKREQTRNYPKDDQTPVKRKSLTV